ncbi:MAG: DUF262 domain-containing protein [Halodesulfovibrio sp.]|uniref:DUF262 domain-containing protein n=1 Tax=Halodesulfovibrio sp. TaxID=1912772 RepID=UPI00359EF12C
MVEQNMLPLEEQDSYKKEPFDPSKVSIHNRIQTVEGVLRRLQQRTIRLSPDFQRNEIWKSTQRSRLIESLLLGIPIPMFYLSEDEKGNWDVVDGLQRLSTIRDFVLFETNPDCIPEEKKAFSKLTNLEFWTDLNNKKFSQLSDSFKNKILETQLSITLVGPRTPDEVKFTIFKRINTAGLVLKEQEIRHALFQGASTELLKKLITKDEFTAAMGGKFQNERMQASEHVLRMLAFIVRDFECFHENAYRKTSKRYNMDSFLSETMIILNASSDFSDKKFRKTFNEKAKNTFLTCDLDVLEEKFTTAMVRARQLFGDYTFRKATIGRIPIVNKSLVDLWGSRLALMSEEAFKSLLENRTNFLLKYKDLLENQEFSNSVSRYGQYWSGIKIRYEKANELIYEITGEKL